MRNRIAALFAAILLATGITVAVPAPAHAGYPCNYLGICGDFTHMSPDNGFDAAIWATCDWNYKVAAAQWVAEGQTATCHDTDGFYIATGRIVECFDGGYWYRFTGPQWKKIDDLENYRCVHRLP